MNFKKIIQEGFKSILSESRNSEIIIEKIGLPSFIADWIENRFPEKYQLWIANAFKDESIAKISGSNSVIKKQIQTKLFKGDSSSPAIKNALKAYQNYYDGAFREIVDWLKGRNEIAPESDQLNLKTLTFNQAKNRATNWHNEVAKLAVGKIDDEDGKVVLTFPDGFYWLDLQKKYCSKEARAMGSETV